MPGTGRATLADRRAGENVIGGTSPTLATDNPSSWTLRGSSATPENEMKTFEMHMASIGHLFRRGDMRYLWMSVGKSLTLMLDTGFRLPEEDIP